MYYNQYYPCMNYRAQAVNPNIINPQMAYPQMANQDMMCMPQQQPMMMDMEDRKLEMMYPKAYYVIMPQVKHHCDMLENKYGSMYCPTKEQLEAIKEEIYKKIDKDLDDCDSEDDDHDGSDNKNDNKHDKHDYHKKHDREDEIKADDDSRRPRPRRRYNRRSAVGDLIGILLLGELLGRRPIPPYAPYPPYPPYGYDYGYGYGY